MLRHGRLITSHADKKPERVFAWYFLFFIELDLRLIGAEELGNPSAFILLVCAKNAHTKTHAAERLKVNPCPLSCLI
jgi:hypothetical protein